MPATASTQSGDNLFGVCAAIGEDFGFDPLWLRIALGAGVLWNPAAMAIGYVALGLLVLATRLLAPDRTTVVAIGQPAAALPPAPPAAANGDAAELARAA